MHTYPVGFGFRNSHFILVAIFGGMLRNLLDPIGEYQRAATGCTDSFRWPVIIWYGDNDLQFGLGHVLLHRGQVALRNHGAKTSAVNGNDAKCIGLSATDMVESAG